MGDKADTQPAMSKDSTITLREITEDNWRTVANLRILPEQEGNLASIPMSMVEAHYSEDAWMRAIYADETIVGFLMMALWPPTEGYYIWRFVIDKRFQGLGFGRIVVQMAIQHVKDTYPQAKRVGVNSTPKEGDLKKNVKAEHSPYQFYFKLGFRQTAEPDEDGEVLMEIDI